MRSLPKPLLMVLAVPVLATAFSMLAQRDWEARWQATLVRQLTAQRMRPDARLLARYSLDSLCGDARSGGRLPPCRTYLWHALVIRASAVVGAAGCLFLAALLLAASLACRRRAWFIRLFRPSLVFAAAGTAILALANAALAMVAVEAVTLYLFGGPVERASVSTALVTGTAAAVWGLGMAASAIGVVRRPTATLIGQRIEAAEHPAFFGEVNRVAAAVGASAPATVVACLAPTLFVTELNVACLEGTVTGRTFCVSLPLLRILTVQEFRALLAHELAHFAGESAGYARRVAPFYTGALRATDRLGLRARGILKAAVVPPRTLVAFYLDSLRRAGEPDGAWEFDADRASAAACGGDVLASAIAKTQAFGAAWYTVAGAMFDAVVVGTQYVNASALFEDVVAWNTSRERLTGLGEQRLGHPTDRHPPLADRLTALDVDPATVADAALDTRPAVPANSLVADFERVERRLSAAEHQLIAATGGEVDPQPA
jgi:Zn-dependent protease with chaperone function